MVTKEEMQKHIEEFQKKAKECPEGGAKCMADDGKLLLPHHDAVVGKDALAKFHKMKKEKDPKGEFDLKLTVDDVFESGDLVVVDGKAVLTNAGKEVDHGKFLHVLRKDGSSFKMVRSMWNTSKPKDGHAC